VVKKKRPKGRFHVLYLFNLHILSIVFGFFLMQKFPMAFERPLVR